VEIDQTKLMPRGRVARIHTQHLFENVGGSRAESQALERNQGFWIAAHGLLIERKRFIHASAVSPGVRELKIELDASRTIFVNRRAQRFNAAIEIRLLTHLRDAEVQIPVCAVRQ